MSVLKVDRGVAPLAAIFGCSGLRLTAEERRFFSDSNPFGFILFARNCQNSDQVRTLVVELRDAVGRQDAPVLIDQEGGRVARLKPPEWRATLPAARYGALARHDRTGAIEAVRLNHQLIAAELVDLGITVDCAPVLDMPVKDSDPIIGDRAFGSGELAATLGRAACEGLMAGGVTPIIKHIPGHGRATVDSHLALPSVDTNLAELEATDFAPFRALRDMPWAMTAHVVFQALDPDRPVTTSPKAIDVVRRTIGFAGVLLSDDLAMKALAGSFSERARASLGAGCDIALHCTGDLAEMQDVADGAGPVSEATAARLARGAAMVRRSAAFDRIAATQRLAELLEMVAAR